MISILLWLAFGFVAGSIAEWVWPPKRPHSRWHTVAIGVAGSVAGGLVGSIITGSYYQPAGLVLSVAGALLCMFAWNKINEEK